MHSNRVMKLLNNFIFIQDYNYLDKLTSKMLFNYILATMELKQLPVLGKINIFR